MDKIKSQINPRQSLVRYIVALALLFVFIAGGHALHVLTAKQGVHDAQVINVSGRQRMLSQRIALLSLRYSETQELEYLQALEASLDQFEDGHLWIVQNAVHSGTAIFDHYFGQFGAQLDERSRQFVEFGREMISSRSSGFDQSQAAEVLETIALNDLLFDLNVAVGLFETAANARLQRLRTIETIAVGMTLLILILEILLVFYPSHVAMSGLISRLKFQAWNDELTGLANRTCFLNHVEDQIAQAKDLDRIFVLALDLDGFKDVNDTLGHPVGDQVLVQVARSLETVLQQAEGLEDSMAARVGGDEFLIYGCAGDLTAQEAARSLANAVIEAVEVPIPVRLDGKRDERCLVGVSIGLALASEAKGSIDVFLSNADIALYESKARGKGVATAFQPSMRETAELRHHRTQELKAGLKSFEFEAFFQPQIDLQTGALHGVEALARWHHPQKGLIAPRDFLSFAEEANVVDALDGQVILSALEAYRRSRDAGFALGRLSLNVSDASLCDPEFCDLLGRIADLNDVRPGEIAVEVLEEALVHGNADLVMETIQKLSMAGFGITIDDFGIGQSSLARVSHLNVSALKIDRSLTVQVGAPAMKKILMASAAMAQGLGAKLLAEGIETPGELSEMKSLGVGVGQGYLWSRPMPLDELENWLEQRGEGSSPVSVAN